MKLVRKLSLLVVIGFSVFAFIGCGEYSVLNSLGFITNNMANTSNELTQFDETNMDNTLIATEYSLDANGVTLLADEEQTPLQTFVDLRKQIIEIHSDILLEKTDLLAYRIEIKDAVDYIKQNQIMLLDDDKASIQSSIDTLKSLRQSLLDTRGKAYQRIVDLRGTYTRDNLPTINQTYSEVSPVLQSRLEMFKQANVELQNIYNILSDYTE